MTFSYFLYLYRYLLFAITVTSDAIICTQQQVDIYMIFLGAFSLLLVIPMVFIDIFSRRAITSRVYVECLWVDFLWLLHLIGVIFVTAFLPHDMCTPQAKSIDGASCTSAKLILAFSWICTINLFIYLVTLVVSAMLHYKQDHTVWSSQVRSYPWYSHTLCHKLGNSPSSPPPRHNHQAPISAPQPRRPIQLPARAVLSFLHKVEHMHVPATQDPGDPSPERRVSQPAMQHTTAPSARFTVLYPLHIQAVWGSSAASPPSGGGGDSAALPPGSASSQMPLRSAPPPSATLPPDGGPPPLWNWPRADIMTLPPPARKKAIAVPPAPEPASAIDPPRQSAQGRVHGSVRSPPATTQTPPV
ncbi:hypothetical protein BJY52DRAFT_1291815 [Lactarius psammicola]|nr:hypothetical protein BJY52DRAFT_1291815 [Lactarius psammicola]